MLYPITLQQVALVLGVLYLAGHGWAFLKPALCRSCLLRLPRHYPVGCVLMAVAGLWFAGLIQFGDLMDYSPYRTKFLLVALLGTGLVIYYLRELLAARALGALLLLLAGVMFDAAFLRNESARLVITVTAYVYVGVGMILVGTPYRLRDFLEWVYSSESRARLAALAGMAFGVLLLLLGLFVY